MAAALADGRVARERNAWTGRFTSDEQVDEYLGGESLECLLCRGTSFRMLGQQLVSEHAMTADAYRDRFGIPRRRKLTVGATIQKLQARPPGSRKLILDKYAE